MRKKTKKQSVIKLNLDRTFEEIRLPAKGGKIKDGKNTVLFEPACVFDERKKRGFLRAKRKIVLFVEGTRNALKFKHVPTPEKGDNYKLELGDFNPFWTMEEAQEFVDTEITKSLKRHKPMTWMQFVIILIPVLVTLGVVIKLALQFGAL